MLVMEAMEDNAHSILSGIESGHTEDDQNSTNCTVSIMIATKGESNRPCNTDSN